MRITAHARGGLSVYRGFYDASRNEAVCIVREGETVSVTIEHASTPSAVTKSADGLTCSTPTTSGNKIIATLSSIQDAGYVDISATVASETRTVRIRARADTEQDRYA